MEPEFVEAVWILTAVFGLFGSAIMLHITRLQVNALIGRNLPAERRQLLKNIRNELGRAALFTINFGIGVWALLIPNPAGVNPIAYLFIAKNVIQAINVILDARMSLADLDAGPDPRDDERDAARDLERDPVRDAARDLEHDDMHHSEVH